MQTTNVIYGSGSYGVVYEVIDHNMKKMAIKCNLIENSIDFIGSLRELDIINKLHGHPNIVYTNYIYFKNPFIKSPDIKTKMSDVKCDSVYFVFESAKTNLLSLISRLSYIDLKKYTLHLLLALEFMHYKGIIHQDIKPSNILISEGGEAQLCDFGLSEIINTNMDPTKYTSTIWYRAPEVSKGNVHTFTADIWSIAMVFIEMIIKKPLLGSCPDNNELLISQILTKVPISDRQYLLKENNTPNVQKIKCRFNNFRSLLKLNAVNIDNFNSTPGTYDQFLDLLENMLLANPENRFTSTKSLDHPFFESYRDVISEYRNKYLIPEMVCLTIDNNDYRKKIMKHAIYFFNKKVEIISPKVIFSSISLFDRYLYWKKIYPEHPLSNDIIKNPLDDLTLKYYICLYIFIKYFTLINTPPCFKIIMGDKYISLYPEIIDFERRLVRDLCKSMIYVKTILDVVETKITEAQTCELLLKYCTCGSIENVNVVELSKALMNNI